MSVDTKQARRFADHAAALECPLGIATMLRSLADEVDKLRTVLAAAGGAVYRNDEISGLQDAIEAVLGPHAESVFYPVTDYEVIGMEYPDDA